MPRPTRKRRGLVVVLGVAILLATLPGVVTAQSGVDGTTVVERGETVSSIEGAYGTIVVEGTVTGDVDGFAGDIVIREGGVVKGNLRAAAGNVRIAGTVEGEVSTGAGSVHVTDTGVVEGTTNIGAGEVRIDGRLDGDATIGADTIRLGDNATIAGSLTYDGTLMGNRDAVGGDVTRDRSIGTGLTEDVLPFVSWVVAAYLFVLNLLLGAVLLGLFPRFSGRVADRVRTGPVRSALVGVVALVVIPLILVAVALTVVGIPLSLVGILAFMLLSWVALVYGRFAVGAWLVSLVGIANRWVGLLTGLVLAAVLGQVPIVGPLLNFGIYLLGLGALLTALFSRRRRVAGPTAVPGPSESSAD